jgi:hypothetical protein
MIDESAKILDLASYRKANAAGLRGADSMAGSVPAMSYGAMSAAPFAIPMAFLVAWPAFVFLPCANQIHGQVGEGRRDAGRAG